VPHQAEEMAAGGLGSWPFRNKGVKAKFNLWYRHPSWACAPPGVYAHPTALQVDQGKEKGRMPARNTEELRQGHLP
jgi:hypothetical protein